jgi:hypothetical protein
VGDESITRLVHRLRTVGKTTRFEWGAVWRAPSARRVCCALWRECVGLAVVGANGVLIDQGTQAVRVGTADVSIITAGQERLRVANDGNIGIGTTDPKDRLHVTASVNQITGIMLGQSITDFNKNGGTSLSAAYSTLGVNAEDDATGKLVNGNTIYINGGAMTHYVWSPNAKGGNIELRAGVLRSIANSGLSSTGYEIGGDVYIDSGPVVGRTDGGSGPFRSPGSIYLRTGNKYQVSGRSAAETQEVDWTTRLVVDGSTGNVGIGITNPAEKLDVNGGLIVRGRGYVNNNSETYALNVSCPDSFNGDGSSVIYSNSINLKAGDLIWGGDARSHGCQIRIGGGRSTMAAIDHSEIRMYTGGSERVTILGNGNVGIGITDPSAKLDVSGNVRIMPSGTNNVSFNIEASGDYAWNYFRLISGDYSSDSQGFCNTISFFSKLRFTGDLIYKPTAGGFLGWSDMRIKENIIDADLDRCCQIIESLPLKRYTLKKDIFTSNQVSDRSRLGWLAQDIKPIFPKAVHVNRLEYTTSDNQKQVIDDALAVDLEQINAITYGAVRKLITDNKRMQVYINDLHSRLQRLESLLSR